MQQVSTENMDTRSIVSKSDRIIHKLYHKLGSLVAQARTSESGWLGRVSGETKDKWVSFMLRIIVSSS